MRAESNIYPTVLQKKCLLKFKCYTRQLLKSSCSKTKSKNKLYVCIFKLSKFMGEKLEGQL